MSEALFAAVRAIVGRGLTQAEVDRINLALGQDETQPSNIQPDPALIAQLKIDEGCVLTAYKDTEGIWTVGYGHAHVQPGTVWTQAKAEAVLIEDVVKHNGGLAARLPWLAGLDPVRRRVLQNMHFNMGWGEGSSGLSSFKNTLEYVRTGDYAKAADGMLASKWAKQVKGRATRLAQQMRTGAA